jgi:hypothetical protein
MKEFTLFTLPKTGTYLAGPLLEKISGRKMKIGLSKDYYIKQTSNYTTCDTEQDFYNDIKKNIPLYMHFKTVNENDFKSEINMIKQNNEFYVNHTPYNNNIDKFLKKNKMVCFFIKRDPRNYIISASRYYGTSKRCIFDINWYQSLSQEDKISYMIKGTEYHNCASFQLKIFKGWLSSSNCHVIDFEELTSNDINLVLKQLRQIVNVLEINLTDKELMSYYNEVYNKGPTSTNSLSNWSNIFTDNHKKICKEYNINKLIVEYGYNL